YAYTRWAVAIVFDAVSTSTHPADNAGGIADHKREIRDIPCHHRSRADESVLSNRNTANDCTIGTEGRAPANERRAQFIHAANFAAWVKHVGKNHRGTAKNIVLECHALINGYIVLDFHPVANAYIGSDDYILPDPAVLANLGVLQDMGNMPDSC